MKDKKFKSAYEMYQSGLSLAKVSEKIGCTRQSLFKAFKRRSYQLRRSKYRLTQEFDGKKFTLRNNGYFSLTIGNRQAMHRYVWEFINGKIPEGYDVHHIDEDRSNNDISNLECLPKASHTKKHGFKNNQYTKNR